MYSLKNISLAVITLSLGMTSMASSANPNDYHIMDNAKAALETHQMEPSATSDPLIDASKFYITLPPVETDAAKANKMDLIDETEKMISGRRNFQKASIEVLANELEVALESGDKDVIKQAYDNYHDGYRDGNLVGMVAIEDKQDFIADLNNRAFFDNNNPKNEQYKQSTDNFINAYKERMQMRRDAMYGEVVTSRINDLNAASERTTPVFEIANNFSDTCAACELEVPQIAVTEPLEPPPEVTPVYRPPERCGGLKYRKGTWIRYHCP